MKDIFHRQNSPPFLAEFILIRYLVYLMVFARQIWWMTQKCLEPRWGRTIRQKIVAVHGTHCTIPARNSNLYTRLSPLIWRISPLQGF
jgi:hypothetical protein